MYILLEHHLTCSKILQVCANVDLKHVHLTNELRRNVVKLVKSINDVTEDGLYCVKSDANINRYNVLQCENTPNGYIYKGERIIKPLYDLEWIYYKTDETSIYNTLLSAELKKYADVVNKKCLSLHETHAGKIRSYVKRARHQPPPLDMAIDNTGV